MFESEMQSDFDMDSSFSHSQPVGLKVIDNE